MNSRWGMVPLRAVVGLVFLMHGYMKAFTMGLAGTTGMFEHLGIPLPQVSAVVVIAVELLGGAALILGLFTRWAAAALAIEMAVVVLVVKLPGGFFAPQGVELELTLFGAALTLALVGAGGVSLDAARRSRSALP